MSIGHASALPGSVAELLDAVVTTHYGQRDLILACTGGLPILRQATAVWADRRVQDAIGDTLCTGSPAAHVDWTMTPLTCHVSVTSAGGSAVLDRTSRDFAQNLITTIGSVSLVILSGTQELPDSDFQDVVSIILRLALRYPLVVAEVRDDRLAHQALLATLRIQVTELQDLRPTASAAEIYADWLQRVKG